MCRHCRESYLTDGFELCEDLRSALLSPFRIDRDNNRLAAVSSCQCRDEFRVGNRCSVQADLVGSGFDRCLHVVLVANAATNTERKEDVLRDGVDRVGERFPFLDGCRHIENDDLIDSFLVVSNSKFSRVAGIAEAFEIDAFDDTAVSNIKASPAF